MDESGSSLWWSIYGPRMLFMAIFVVGLLLAFVIAKWVTKDQ
jgi:hypothetical protein